MLRCFIYCHGWTRRALGAVWDICERLPQQSWHQFTQERKVAVSVLRHTDISCNPVGDECL